MGLRKMFSEKVAIDFEKHYGHLNDKEQTLVKVLLILQKISVYFIFFAIGTLYSYFRFYFET